ncbi:MAG TPA: signal peptidase I [Actinomycetota bacterium]|nr:signal peptidase I [Actinomycetota bacterium]
MPRVDEVARSLGMTSEEVIARLDALGTPVPDERADVDDATVERLRAERPSDGAGPAAPSPAPDAQRTGDGRAAAGAAGGTTLAEKLRGKPAEAATEPARRDEPAAAATEPARRDEPAAPKKTRTPKKPKKKRSALARIAEIPVLIVLAFVIAIVIKTYLVQAFYIPSGSMRPTLQVGDRVLIEKLSYRFSDPDRGDVVVFERSAGFGAPAPDVPWTEDVRNFARELLGLPTPNAEQDFIKRIVAVGGDVFTYAGEPRRLVVNGERVEEPYVRGGPDRVSQQVTAQNCRALDMKARDGGCVVPAGKVFVMGDNRANSSDSRTTGPVDEDKVLGRAFVVIWPPADFGGL